MQTYLAGNCNGSKLASFNGKGELNMRRLSLCAALSMLAGCATTVVPTFTPVSFVGKIDDSYKVGDVLTAQDGDVVFRQRITGGNLASLDGDFKVDKFSSYSREFNVPAGALLQPGYIVSEQGSGIGFCSLGLTSKSKSLLGETYSSRTCFVDSDRSGDFDFAFQGDGTWSSIIQKQDFDIEYRTLKESVLMGGVPIEPSIPYSLVDEKTPVDANFFIYYYARSTGGARFKMYSDLSGSQKQLADGIRVFGSNLPESFSMNNVTIEIISVDNGVLKYRIRNGLRENKVISTSIG